MEAANKDSRALSTAMAMTVAPTNAVSRDPGKQKHKPVSCFRCGGEHLATQCRHARSVCQKCRSKGHLARVCKGKAATFTSGSGSAFLSPKHQSIHTVDDAESRSETPEPQVYEMWQVRAPDHDGSPYRVVVSVNVTSLIMELDTGAIVSVVSEETFRRTFPSCRLEPSSVMLKGYTGELSPVQGSLRATVRLGKHEFRDVLCLVPGRCPSLMGRGWMKGLGIELRNVMDVKAITSVEGLVAEYASVFDDTLGTFKGVSAKITIEDNAKPMSFKARLVPFAMIDRRVPEMCSPRIMRWALIIGAYNHKLMYRPGACIANADGLNHLPLPVYAQPVERSAEVFMLEAAYPRVLRSTVVAEATSKDPTLVKLRDALWSGAELRDPEFRSYADRKLQPDMRGNVLLRQLKQKIVHDGGAGTTLPARPGD
ncbi:hypothetical protein MTO96_035466 [Rhipicephalus appendiculatus]